MLVRMQINLPHKVGIVQKENPLLCLFAKKKALLSVTASWGVEITARWLFGVMLGDVS